MILHDTRTDPSLVAYSCRKNSFDKCISLFKTIISESFPCQCKFVHELYSGFMLFFLGVSLWAVFFKFLLRTCCCLKDHADLRVSMFLDADFLQLWAMTMHIQKSQNWMMFEQLQKPLLIKVKTAVSDQDFP